MCLYAHTRSLTHSRARTHTNTHMHMTCMQTYGPTTTVQGPRTRHIISKRRRPRWCTRRHRAGAEWVVMLPLRQLLLAYSTCWFSPRWLSMPVCFVCMHWCLSMPVCVYAGTCAWLAVCVCARARMYFYVCPCVSIPCVCVHRIQVTPPYLSIYRSRNTPLAAKHRLRLE